MNARRVLRQITYETVDILLPVPFFTVHSCLYSVLFLVLVSFLRWIANLAPRPDLNQLLLGGVKTQRITRDPLNMGNTLMLFCNAIYTHTRICSNASALTRSSLLRQGAEHRRHDLTFWRLTLLSFCLFSADFGFTWFRLTCSSSKASITSRTFVAFVAAENGR